MKRIVKTEKRIATKSGIVSIMGAKATARGPQISTFTIQVKQYPVGI